MRFLKGSVIFTAILALQAAALYYIADLLPQPFYAGQIILFLPALALCAAAFYMGYHKNGILLLHVLALILLLMPFQLACCILLPQYFDIKNCLIYSLILLLPLFFAGYSARAIYLQKSSKNEE